ncbi:MAG: hypothetical protein OEY89_16560 [Gammaproteobacteria bacterium]|nr:hypothetical protein [Gammaproteobacteria bacterium]
MNDEKIRVRVTENDQLLDVIVLKKTVNQIDVVIGEGVHNVKCSLHPTANGLAYEGNIMGREIVYETSREQVEADIAHTQPSTRRR